MQEDNAVPAKTLYLYLPFICEPLKMADGLADSSYILFSILSLLPLITKQAARSTAFARWVLVGRAHARGSSCAVNLNPASPGSATAPRSST